MKNKSVYVVWVGETKNEFRKPRLI